MKHARLLLIPVVLVVLSACGQDRGSMATQTVLAYWSDIDHGKIDSAYHMMTTGNQNSRPLKDYRQDMFGFLVNMAAVKVSVTGKPILNDDRATVPIAMSSPKSPAKLHGYQHLFWENGRWRISDAGGGISRTK